MVNDNSIKWFMISLMVLGSVSVLCFTLIILHDSPFEFSVVANDNIVDITENFKDMADAVAVSNADLVRCETKLLLYNKTHGDYWGNVNE